MGFMHISPKNARKAAQHIENIYGTTPILPLETLTRDDITINLSGKFDNVQSVYTFKARGAEWFTHNLMIEYMTETGRFRTKKEKPLLITASAGNHAQGVALAAQRYGLDALIFMPESTPDAKKNRVTKLGAEIVLVDGFFDEALSTAKSYKDENENAIFVPPFENPYIMEGQATVGVEILSQLCPYDHNYMKLADLDWLDWKTPDVIICGLGGGGLSSGIGSVAKEFNEKSSRDIKVIGVQTETANSMYNSIKAGGILTESTDMEAKSIADGIAVKQASERMVPTVMNYVDQVVLVSEEDIKGGIAYIHQHPHLINRKYKTSEIETPCAPYRRLPGGNKQVLYRERPLNRVEGAAAAPYAAVLFGDTNHEIDWNSIAGNKNELNVICVLTGSNISSGKYKELSNYVKRPEQVI